MVVSNQTYQSTQKGEAPTETPWTYNYHHAWCMHAKIINESYNEMIMYQLWKGPVPADCYTNNTNIYFNIYQSFAGIINSSLYDIWSWNCINMLSIGGLCLCLADHLLPPTIHWRQTGSDFCRKANRQMLPICKKYIQLCQVVSQLAGWLIWQQWNLFY